MSLRGAINGSLLILGAAWSKSSFAVTLLRMTTGGLRGTIIVVMATMNAFVGVSPCPVLPRPFTRELYADLTLTSLQLIASIFVNHFSCNPPSKTIDPMTPGVCWDEKIHIGVDVAASGEF